METWANEGDLNNAYPDHQRASQWWANGGHWNGWRLNVQARCRLLYQQRMGADNMWMRWRLMEEWRLADRCAFVKDLGSGQVLSVPLIWTGGEIVLYMVSWTNIVVLLTIDIFTCTYNIVTDSNTEGMSQNHQELLELKVGQQTCQIWTISQKGSHVIWTGIAFPHRQWFSLCKWIISLWIL